jgi:glutathione synthase/RimK-type ligase-like ATP-grasp enzyme
MKIKKKKKLAILKNEDPFDHLKWVDACEDYQKNIDYKVFDLTVDTWLEEVNTYSPDILLLKPSGKTSLYRNLYQERLEILVTSLKYKSFPSLDEVRIYENKRYFAYWAKAHELPHPKTWVYYNRNEALKAAKMTKLPLVGKMNIGASGKGVQILHTKDQVKKYIKRAFSDGLVSSTGPKWSQGKLIQRAWQKFTHPKELINRLRTYRDIAMDSQKGFVILQEFIKHDYEWRAVRIGDSYFAHKKIVSNEKASGSLEKEYGAPPIKLLDFVRQLTDSFAFTSVAIDVFEPVEGQYLINEIQCIFGQSDPHQMIIDGNPGRYLFKNGQWVFEKGDFNTNESYDLRLKTAIELNKLEP